MDEFELLDHPEILQFIFYPRRDFYAQPRVANASSHLIPVDEGISISCRFYLADGKAPNILFFHGNGEIASDYDQIAPLFTQIGVNFFVADYRGYGSSGGQPTFSAMMKDAHPVFDGFKNILKQEGYSGKLFMMGRSLGSASAIELAFNHQDEMGGLIIESGFASVGRLVDLIDVPVDRLGFDRQKLSFNVERIASITIPTLIIHGEYDNLIPLQHGRDLYRSSGAKDKQLMVIPGATHNDIFLVGMDDYLKAMKEFVIAQS
jgi:hypothetical protein